MIKHTLVISATFLFFFNDTATTEIYTLSLHDALPICGRRPQGQLALGTSPIHQLLDVARSEEHTSELQSRLHLVCRLLLEKKKTVKSTAASTGRGPFGVGKVFQTAVKQILTPIPPLHL